MKWGIEAIRGYELNIDTPMAKVTSLLTSEGFLLPKAKSISSIADVQDCGVPSPLRIQCI